MLKYCTQFKRYCQEHPALGTTIALAGMALLVATIWGSIVYQLAIYDWLRANLLVHGLVLGLGMLLDALVVFGLLCMGFAECDAYEHGAATYRGRRTPVFPEALSWIEHLGRKPGRP